MKVEVLAVLLFQKSSLLAEGVPAVNLMLEDLSVGGTVPGDFSCQKVQGDVHTRHVNLSTHFLTAWVYISH